MEEGKLIFVLADTKSGKVRQLDRDIIRSRYMRGKNVKTNSRRSLRAAQLAAHTLEQIQSGPNPSPIQSSTDPISTSLITLRRPCDHTRMEDANTPMLDLEIAQLIHQDSVMYPREFISNCEYPFPYTHRRTIARLKKYERKKIISA